MEQGVMPKTVSLVDLSDYAPVADRLTLFYSKHPNGRVITDLVSRESGEITFRARIYRSQDDRAPAATGWASERIGDGEVNEAACLENTETSAVGRALANLGFVASTKRPSREEMEKVGRVRLQYADSRRPRESRQLQRQANSAQDILDLVSAAQLCGMSAKRIEILRSGALQPLPPPRVEKLEAGLRAWLRRHHM
jgi:hypothetical protein